MTVNNVLYFNFLTLRNAQQCGVVVESWALKRQIGFKLNS